MTEFDDTDTARIAVSAEDWAEWERYIKAFQAQIVQRKQETLRFQPLEAQTENDLDQANINLTDAQTFVRHRNAAVVQATQGVATALQALRNASGAEIPAAEQALAIAQHALKEAKSQRFEADRALQAATSERQDTRHELRENDKQLNSAVVPAAMPAIYGVDVDPAKKVAGIAAFGEVLRPDGPVKLNAHLPDAINRLYDIKINFRMLESWVGVSYAKAYVPWWPSAIRQADGRYRPETLNGRIIGRLRDGRINNAGVTLGPKINLGLLTPALFFRNLQATNSLLKDTEGRSLVSTKKIEALEGHLAAYFGKRGATACWFLRANPLEIDGDILSLLTFSAYDYPIKKAKSSYEAIATRTPFAPAFNELSEASQTVLIARFHQAAQIFSERGEQQRNQLLAANLAQAFAERDHEKAGILLLQATPPENVSLDVSSRLAEAPPHLLSQQAYFLREAQSQNQRVTLSHETRPDKGEDAKICGSLSQPAATGAHIRFNLEGANHFSVVDESGLVNRIDHQAVNVDLQPGQQDFSLALLYTGEGKPEAPLNLNASYVVPSFMLESQPSNSLTVFADGNQPVQEIPGVQNLSEAQHLQMSAEQINQQNNLIWQAALSDPGEPEKNNMHTATVNESPSPG